MIKIEQDERGRYWLRQYLENGSYDIVMNLSGYSTYAEADEELTWVNSYNSVVK